MTQKENADPGGLAFPSPHVYYPTGEISFGEYGMTLRDYFAGQVVGHIFSQIIQSGSKYSGLELSMNAYEIADAMIEARNQ